MRPSTGVPAMSRGERFRRVVRTLLPWNLYIPLAKMLDAAYCISTLGFAQSLRLRALSTGSPECSHALETLKIPTLRYPIHVRPGSSDLEEVIYTTIRQAYRHYLPSGPVRVVIDAGAYIGDSTAWYLSKFPEATVVAIEPNPENFRLLEMNCRPYGERAQPVLAALWSKTGRLDLSHTAAWDSVSVRQAQGGTDCQGISMPDLMRSHAVTTVDVLKLDIEDAELSPFSTQCDTWLSQVRTIAIEIHSRSSLEAVMAATRRHHFSHRVYRNLHFFSRCD